MSKHETFEHSWVDFFMLAGAAPAEAQHQQGRVAANAVSFEAPQTSGMRLCGRCCLQVTSSVFLCVHVMHMNK